MSKPYIGGVIGSSALDGDGVFSLGSLSGDGASSTRPTRKWGGITGRSLVSSVAAVEATLPASPEIGIFRGDTTQGSTTPTTVGTPTTGGTGIDSYYQTSASTYYTFTPAATSSWTLVWSADHTNQAFSFIATMNGINLQVWNTASGGLKVYDGTSQWVADSMSGLSYGDRYYFALRYDGTTLKSYRWDGAAAMTALPTAASDTGSYSISASTAYINQYSAPSTSFDHQENVYSWAFYGSSLLDADLIDVFNTIAGFNDSAGGGAGGDANWDDVVLLLDGSSTTDVTGTSTVTPSGSGYTTNNTTGAKFNQYIDFQNSGYFNVSFSSALGVGDEPFTVECWAYLDAISDDGIFELYHSGSVLDGTTVGSNSIAFYANTGVFKAYAYGSLNSNVASASTGQWYHLAVVYDGTDLNYYVDGTSGYSRAKTMPAGGWTNMGVGGYYTTTYVMDGRIEGLRVTKGVARYTADFTPPTEAFPTSAGGTASLENTGIMTLAEHYQHLLSVPSSPPGDGLTAATAGDSASQILTDYPSSTDGIYYIKDGAGTKQVYCDMTNGGWMLYTSFATNSTYDATTYPAWNGNRIGHADMKVGGTRLYGWEDDSLNGRDGTTTWGNGFEQNQQNGNDGPVYMFWNYGGDGSNKGVKMTQWNGPSTITELRVGWGKGASSFSGSNNSNYLMVNGTDTANSPKDSQTSIIEEVSFNPTGATPLLFCYEADGTIVQTQGINGISSVWMK